VDDTLQKFKAVGASSVAGTLMYRGKEVALLRHGQVFLTDAGHEALAQLNVKAQATDVEAKPARPPEAPKATGLTPPKPAKPAKAKAPPAPSIPDASPSSSEPPADLTNIDALLEAK